MDKNRYIQTVLNRIPADSLGLTLPHEHLYTDLRGPRVPNYARSNPDHVVSVMKPYLDEISHFGVKALVECSTIGVGRNPIILKKLALNTPIQIIAPTGVYRQAFVPPDLISKSSSELADMWVRDITEGIEGTDVKAGFIKMAVSDEGITPLEAKNLKAAFLASQKTGAVIASHTIGGKLALEEMDLLENFGLDLKRFIWTHAQSETDITYHQEAAKRGAYISIDAIGSGWAPDEDMLEYTLALIEAGFNEQILLSHDAGWYDPSQSNGHPADNGIRGYTALFKSFLPELRFRGVNEDIITRITKQNPGKAFAFSAA
jgi:phosphotriesterase-related protein